MGAGDRVCEEPRSRRLAGSRTTRLLLESRPASWETEPQLSGPRPLAVSASFPHTPPRPPEPQAFPALLLLLFTLALRPGSSCRLPALFPPGLVLVLRLSFHTHTRRLGRPLPSALLLLVLVNAAVGGGLMSLQHHAAAAEEGESYTRTEKHSS